MKKLIFSMLAIITIISVIGCASPVSAAEVKSDKPRTTSPSVSPQDLAALVKGNTDFAFNLYHKLISSDGDMLFSPYSISEALAMTWAGAQGKTANQMASALNFNLNQNALHPAFNSLDLALKSRDQTTGSTDQTPFQLNVVNAIWGQKDFKFQSNFLDVLAQNYGAGLRIVDFINKTEASRTTINDWVAEQTKDKIQDLLPQGSVDAYTRLVLTNAVYFKAGWLSKFDKAATTNGTFNLVNGNTVTVQMMQQSAHFNYYDGGNYEAVELPYYGNQLSMVVIVPKSGQFNAFEQSLNGDTFRNITGNLNSAYVILQMPKFKFDSSFGLKSALTALGMTDAFNPTAADFSGMDGKQDLFIQDVVHKAYISLDENGTEAAAATGVIMSTTSMPTNEVHLTIDRPFLFAIRDISTGSILFTGRVMNPAQ
ncbi:MAG TPA: serpin family protein [Dehalococcoidales bacterium]|nr:serpin family protein [Dehalococcoidales bacterium]